MWHGFEWGPQPAGEADPYRDSGPAVEPASGTLNGLDAKGSW